LAVAPAQKKVWTILEMLQWGASYLAEKGFDESRLTIELLLGHVLNLKRIQLYTSFDKPLTEAELALFKALLQRRLQREPLQYIVGSTEFMGRKFAVDRRVLIPRPETEVVVEQAIRLVQERFPGQTVRVLEVGTGSGCIAVSLAAMVENASVTAIDKSSGAVDVALVNAEMNGVRGKISFTVNDFLAMSDADFSSRYHLIVSNPPYISKKQFAGLQPEIRNFEPPFALTDEDDGLSFYRPIAHIGKNILEPGGAIIVEHAFDQSESVTNIFSEEGYAELQPFDDYSGNRRGLIAAKFLRMA
jgi:release factor glutamine methyltransferase